jgi:hypothetical protein
VTTKEPTRVTAPSSIALALDYRDDELQAFAAIWRNIGASAIVPLSAFLRDPFKYIVSCPYSSRPVSHCASRGNEREIAHFTQSE